VNSIDTNILLYGTNADCPEHQWARPVLERMLANPSEWILADQVLFEYYRLVRNPAVVEKPLSAKEASQRIRFFRQESGCLHCGYDISCWTGIFQTLSAKEFSAGRVFDLVLAVTLKHAGVTTFYTRNIRDFKSFGCFELVNPEEQ